MKAFGKIVGIVAILCIGLFMAFNSNEVEVVETVTMEAPIVLELFTSQGCSSCPAADRLLASIDTSAAIIVLSYHVDYWNRLGWKDTFSKPEYSDYQRRYARGNWENRVYTPQVVVNGSQHFVGSNASELSQALRQANNREVVGSIEIETIEKNERFVNFTFTTTALETNELKAVLVLDHKKVEIKRGENRNRTIDYHNIVLSEKGIDAISGSGTILIPDTVPIDSNMSLVLLSQKRNYHITTANKKAL